MNRTQAEQIAKLRNDGIGYQRIADTVGISVNTVKSHCRRKNVGAQASSDTELCPQCGEILTHTKGAKKRKFCSDACRIAWWNAHPEAVTHRVSKTVFCGYCGKQFTSYGSRKRKYCSHDCYAKAKAAAVE